DGLNLTWDTLEGLAKHNGPIDHPEWALAEADAAFPLELASWPSLEAQVAALRACQRTDGLWPTILDDPDSYGEASATAGIAYG
ncbi:glycoside hydrolase family 88 protein, partial [Proteus mirabilis]|uniref:glycoside hydrolase family 88 protein n=1 Tax=Proteus mirabilis TaxID=584 RepID=UPI00195416A9